MQQALIAREEFLRREDDAILGTKFLTESVFVNELWKLAGTSNLELASLTQVYVLICQAFRKQQEEPTTSKIRQVYQLIRQGGVLLCSDEILTQCLSENEI
ncbi:MAG: hypothetical protein HUJ51_05790, partial [Eggerthellaceae bacterium]|nr:hypothetical protein [Eggerthellaceae bacterium]